MIELDKIESGRGYVVGFGNYKGKYNSAFINAEINSYELVLMQFSHLFGNGRQFCEMKGNFKVSSRKLFLSVWKHWSRASNAYMKQRKGKFPVEFPFILKILQTNGNSTMSHSKPLRKPRFKDWLVFVLDNEVCTEYATWKDRARRTAIIRWPHKCRGKWNLEKDAYLFKMWAIDEFEYL